MLDLYKDPVQECEPPAQSEHDVCRSKFNLPGGGGGGGGGGQLQYRQGTHGTGKTENGPKKSLSGKTQGIWKFCQNTGNCV